MLGQHQQKINNIRLKGILSVDTTTPFTPKSHQKVVDLSNGSRLIDTEQKTRLILNGQTLATWPTERWILLGVSLDEQTAFFEESSKRQDQFGEQQANLQTRSNATQASFDIYRNSPPIEKPSFAGAALRIGQSALSLF